MATSMARLLFRRFAQRPAGRRAAMPPGIIGATHHMAFRAHATTIRAWTIRATHHCHSRSSIHKLLAAYCCCFSDFLLCWKMISFWFPTWPPTWHWCSSWQALPCEFSRCHCHTTGFATWASRQGVGKHTTRAKEGQGPKRHVLVGKRTQTSKGFWEVISQELLDWRKSRPSPWILTRTRRRGPTSASSCWWTVLRGLEKKWSARTRERMIGCNLWVQRCSHSML